MKRSDDRILTTHVGSLPRPPGMAPLLYAKDAGREHDRAALARGIRDSVSDVVRRQLAFGLDVVNDGEHSKFNFIAYGRMRLSGLGPNPKPVPMLGGSRWTFIFWTSATPCGRLRLAGSTSWSPASCNSPIALLSVVSVSREIRRLCLAC